MTASGPRLPGSAGVALALAPAARWPARGSRGPSGRAAPTPRPAASPGVASRGPRPAVSVAACRSIEPILGPGRGPSSPSRSCGPCWARGSPLFSALIGRGGHDRSPVA